MNAPWPTTRSRCVRLLLVFAVVLAAISWGRAADAREQAAGAAVTLDQLVAGIDVGNQGFLAATFKARQYGSRVGLAPKLDDSLLAYYYLGFPARILREEPAPTAGPGADTAPGRRRVTETLRGQALFERSSFMIKSMTESRAAWYQAVSDDLHLQLVRQVREDFFRLYCQDRIIAVTEETLATLEQLLATTRERYAVGQVAQRDVLQAQNEKTLVASRLLELRQERLALATKLNYLAGRDPAAPLQPQLAAPLSHASLVELTRSDAELTAYMKQHRPLVKGYKALIETFGIMRLMIPMYYNKALRQDGTLEVDSGMRAARAELLDFQNQVAADLVVERGRLAKDLAQAKLYGDVLIPQAREQLASSRADFAVGRADLRRPLQDIVTLNQYQVDYFRTLADHQGSLARLEADSALPLF